MTGKRESLFTSEFRDSAHTGLVPQLAIVIRVLLASPARKHLLFLTTAVFLVVIATVYEQIALNSWNKPFYNALSHRHFDGFITQLGVFAQIAGVLLVLNVVQKWLNLMTKLKLREGLTQDLVQEWLKPQRAFLLAFAGSIGINPDQRMHEDTAHLTDLSADLGIGFFQASVLLASFIAVLWVLSGSLDFRFMGHDIVVPGYMVWAAIIYAGSASFLTYLTGRPLVPQNAERYSREAALRFSLMRVNEHINAISVSGGETDEQGRIKLDLRSVLDAMRSLVATLTRLTWVTAGYGWFTLVAPIIVAAPMYFAGHLSFGGLMMAVGAFNQVQASLRWFVDNFSIIADWRATLFRVVSFRNASMAMDVLDGSESRIAFVEGERSDLTLENVEISSPGGCIKLREGSVTVKAGERVLIVGAPRSGKTLLFYALTGLWHWGSGNISWPKGETVLHVPRTPYFPPGTLREVLAYPSNAVNFETNRLIDALDRLGLQRLTPMLDSIKPWHRELSVDEQQKVAFSRALLQRPAWILIDEALEAVYEETRQHIKDVLAHDLERTGLIYIGRTDTSDHFYSRVFHIERDPCRRVFSPWTDLAERPASASQLTQAPLM
ncbi:ABC transporter ATP-binding protein/permease [Methylovirgula sp. HY1]|uniref:ABC transporter ATP-binding protein/permease n=1 Tax=Methylovirgula sp. HY1 TaxID=2822761 RepID=UPI001C5B2C6F|nr:ABC transporter ATP-binding protein/permease [Methylovirgula sp. HY1]QXX74590.1 Inner membrane ABC transporter ATP-binding protein YddA [Methylovirgula sp. HY1]